MYVIEVTDSALDDLRFLRKYDRTIVVDAINELLSFEPSKETRNKKRLEPNPLSEWELRVDRFRVFFDVDDDAKTVSVVAVGWKEHNKLLIRGKEFSL
jgi:mRNA-degrading endonuclease RelE of RelBE toxin-antitoxin system